jgi:hypothetical protein
MAFVNPMFIFTHKIINALLTNLQNMFTYIIGHPVESTAPSFSQPSTITNISRSLEKVLIGWFKMFCFAVWKGN